MKRKVLIIVENSPVPLDPRVWNEASSLQANGYDVTVLSPRAKGCERPYEVISGVRIYRHPTPREGNGLTSYIWEYTCALFWQVCYSWWIYLRHGFHVIQGCNPPDTIFMVALPFKAFGVKYIFDHHDAIPELYFAKYGKGGFVYHIQKLLEKMTYWFSDVVMATNGSYREFALARGGIGVEDVFVVRNGPDPASFKATSPNLSRKYGKTYLVGYVGVMAVQDSLDILLEVASLVKGMGRHDVHFTCVGGGSAFADLQRMVREKNLGGMVTFTGRIPQAELLEILSTADVCVNPDRPCEMNDKSTMIKIMEYMALGKPIVQFDLKEGRISAGEASLYADTSKGVSDFAAKLLWLLDHPDERARMGTFGRRRVEEELAWKYSVPHLLAAYEKGFDKRKSAGAMTRSVPSELKRVKSPALPSEDHIK